MKAVLLAGGLGSRLREETTVRPKPMVEIGGNPMLWHIMNIYAAHGFSEFVVALGYRGDVDQGLLPELPRAATTTSRSSLRHRRGRRRGRPRRPRTGRCTSLDTGLHTPTGGRVKRAAAVRRRRDRSC